MFLIPFYILLLLYSFAAPWPWIWRVWAFLFMLGGILSILLGGDYDKEGPGIGLGSLVMVMSIFSVAAIVVIRFLWSALSAVGRHVCNEHSPPSSPERWRFDRFDPVIVVAAGMLAGLLLCGPSGGVLKDVGLSYLTHGLTIVIAVECIARIVHAWLRNPDRRFLRCRLFILSASLVAAPISLAGVFYPKVIMADAMAKADGRPYCIAMKRSGRPVLSIQDMTYFGFDRGGNLGNGRRHHAILLVDRQGEFQPYHWSYRRAAFQPSVWFWDVYPDRLSQIPYRPKEAFVEQLPILRWPNLNSKLFYVDGHLLDIPDAYRPAKRSDEITIAAAAPTFEPALDPGEVFQVSAEPGERLWMSATADDALDMRPTRRIGDLSEVRMNEHGLTVMFRLDDRNRPDVFVTCADEHPAEWACRHRFQRDRTRYVFRQGSDLIDHSARMQQSLVDLFRSFEVPR